MANRDMKQSTKSRERAGSASLSSHHSAKLRSIFGARPAPEQSPRSDRDAARDPDREPDRARDRDKSADKAKDRDRDRDKGKDKEKDNKNRHHHSDRHHHHKKQHTYIRVDLRDLDYRLDSFSLSVKTGTRASKLESFVRSRHDDRRNPLPEAARIHLYLDGKALQRHSVLGQPSIIWYRLATARDDGDWKITRWQDATSPGSSMDSRFTSDLVRAIEAGETVGRIRRMAAEHMGIEDHNRVIIIARTGMRPGIIQGDSWQVRQVRSWLCHWLSIDVCRKNGYVVLEGLCRRYIYHPEPSYLQKGLDLKRVKRWMEQRLFTYVGPLGRNDLALKPGQIHFTRNGHRVDSLSLVDWGTMYGFYLDDTVAEALAKDEAWLLPATETCSVCADDKKVTDLPIRITAGCDHKPALCRDCMRHWIHSSLETTSWDRLKCPECPCLLKYPDVKRCAAPADFSRYDDLATRAVLKEMPNFKWCLSPTCESGQIHDASCPKLKCTACKSKQCAVHDVPWHSGETCQEYDKRNRQRQEEERASEEVIQKTSKRCPECKKDVHKWTGCNHITCVCGHEWCYICFAPFKQNQHGFLYCRHNPGCSEHDPFIDLIDPPRGQPPAVAGTGRFRFPPPLLRPRQEPRRELPPAPPALRQPGNRRIGGQGGRDAIPPPLFAARAATAGDAVTLGNRRRRGNTLGAPGGAAAAHRENQANPAGGILHQIDGLHI